MGSGPRIDCSGEKCFTQQSAAAECDINLIMERARRGEVVPVREGTPMYADLVGLPDYRESLNMVNKARDMFMELPWNVRERFQNDPARLLDFLGDDKNREEGVKLGLLKAPEAPVVDLTLEEIKALRKDLKGSSGAK